MARLYDENVETCHGTSLLVCENLNIKGMVKNHCLAQAIAQVG
ncbi:hypothetical protein [Planktothrix mougeotii]